MPIPLLAMLGYGALKSPDIANDWVGLYKNVRDFNSSPGAAELLNDYAEATGPEDVKFIQKTAGTYGITDPSHMLAAQEYGNKRLEDYAKLDKDKNDDAALQAFQDEAQASGQNLFAYAMANPGRIPLTALEKANGVFGTLQRGAENEMQRREKEKVTARNQEFIGNANYYLREPSHDKMTQAFGELVNETAPSPEVAQQWFDNLVQYAGKQAGPIETIKVGRTTKIGQRDAFGNFKGDAQSVAPVTKVTVVSPQQSGFVDPTTGAPLLFYKATGTYRPAKVEGGGGVAPKPLAMTPEKAAKEQLINQAVEYIPTIRSLILPGGKIDRTNVAMSQVRMPFTEGRQASTLILDAVEAKLRAESGAAVPDQEVKRIAKRYIPQIGDDDNTVMMKLDNMEQFLYGTQKLQNTGRSQQVKGDNGRSGAKVDTSRPVQKNGVRGYRQPNGTVVDANGKRLN